MVLRALLEEMTGLFPDDVFHIGTDEIIEQNKTGLNNTGHCTIAQIADLERFLLAEVLRLGKTPMAWHDVLTSTNASSAFPHLATILGTWGRDGKHLRFGAANATALGYRAVESSGMYLLGRHSPFYVPEGWKKGLWADIGQGVHPSKVHLMLGGEVSFWCNSYCSFWIIRRAQYV